MAKSPNLPPRKPKDPARPTRAKASRPDSPATPDALADLLNPAINKGTSGMGSGTGPDSSFRGASATSEPGIQKQSPSQPLDSGPDASRRPGMTESGIQPPPDNSFDRRADFSASHRARKSASEGKGFGEAPQADYTGAPVTGLDPALAQELGLGGDAPPDPFAASAKEAERIARGGDPKYRLPKADLPTGPGGLASMGVAATAQALENLLREGRPEFAAQPWMPQCRDSPNPGLKRYCGRCPRTRGAA